MLQGKVIFIYCYILQQGEMIIGNQAGFLGPRNAPPNQFLRQSPSPSAVSPIGMGTVGSNQMAVSPALVPSPSGSQLTPVMSGPPRSNGISHPIICVYIYYFQFTFYV